MKKKIFIIPLIAVLLSTQFVLKSPVALAQNYGESTYGGGVYNDTVDGSESEEPTPDNNAPNPGNNSGSNTNTDSTPRSGLDGSTDDAVGTDSMGQDDLQSDSETTEPVINDDVRTESGDNERPSPNDSATDDESSLPLLSAAAIVGALVLICIGIVIRRSRQ
jgi:hypothetical protein